MTIEDSEGLIKEFNRSHPHGSEGFVTQPILSQVSQRLVLMLICPQLLSYRFNHQSIYALHDSRIRFRNIHSFTTFLIFLVKVIIRTTFIATLLHMRVILLK